MNDKRRTGEIEGLEWAAEVCEELAKVIREGTLTSHSNPFVVLMNEERIKDAECLARLIRKRAVQKAIS
jgi:hypothetical protein